MSIRVRVPDVELERSWFRTIQEQLPERFIGSVEALVNPIHPDIEVEILGIRFGEREIGCYLTLEQGVRTAVRSYYIAEARSGMEGDAHSEEVGA